MNIDDRVIMLHSDGWVNKGSTGIVSGTREGTTIEITWDNNGQRFIHLIKNVALLDKQIQRDNPNMIFRRKYKGEHI